jgi:DNA-binding transcriptional ArsR family regulator
VLVATAALMCCDAWFDVMLDWNGPDRWASLLMAATVEVPVAILLLARARLSIVDILPARVVTLADIDDVLTDRTCERLLRELGAVESASVAQLSSVLGLAPATVSAKLAVLAGTGHVRRAVRDRWRAVPHNMFWPHPDEVPEPDRERYRAFVDARYDREIRLLTRAARERDRLGVWGKASRSTAHLTAAELARFDREYHELMFRYTALHERATPGTTLVALRFYAFPQSLADGAGETDGAGDTNGQSDKPQVCTRP